MWLMACPRKKRNRRNSARQTFEFPRTEKSALWTDSSVDQNFEREIRMDQWPVCLAFRQICMDQWDGWLFPVVTSEEKAKTAKYCKSLPAIFCVYYPCAIRRVPVRGRASNYDTGLDVGMCLCELFLPIGLILACPRKRVLRKLTYPGKKDERRVSYSEKKKADTTTTERKYFGELFWPQRKTFQASGRYKALQNQENHIYHRNLSSAAPIYFQQEKFFTGARRCMLYFPKLLLKSIFEAPSQVLRQAHSFSVAAPADYRCERIF